MKKSDELRLSTRKMIAKNLIVLVVLTIVAFVGAFSWFTQNTKATADGISAKTEASDSLEFFIREPSSDTVAAGYSNVNSWLSTYNTNHPDAVKSWHKGELTFDSSDDEFRFLSELFLCEVTSDGKDFYEPKMTQSGDHAYVDEGSAMSPAVMNTDYMSFDIYFRSTAQYDVVLKHDSTIAPTSPSGLSGQHDYDANDSENDSLVKPAAIGAVRLSVLNGTDKQLIWIPGPCVWFNGLTNHLYTGLSSTGTGNYSFENKGSVYNNNGEPTLRTSERTTDHTYYYDNGGTPERAVIADGTSPLRSSKNGDYALGSSSTDDVSVCTLSNTVTENGTTYYYNRVRVNLWIEGEDSEARLKFVDGTFNMALKFDVRESADSGN